MTLPAAAMPSPTSASNGVINTAQRPPKDPATWTFTDAQNVVAGQSPQWMPTARAFVVDGDHWQNGLGWIGPMPLPGADGYAETFALVRSGFTFRNALAEVTERYTDGCVGTEPDWHLTPREALEDGEEPAADDQALIDEAEAALTEWWDRDGIASLFWAAVYQMTWGQRSPFRLFVSRAAFVNGTAPTPADDPEAEPKTVRVIPKQATLADALKSILLDVPKADTAAVYVDPDTHREVGVYIFKTDDGNDAAEICFLDGEEVVIRTVGAKEGQTKQSLGGLLPHHQVIRPTRLITDAAFSLQRALNLALSVVPRTITTAGFLERVLINAKMPGTWISDANGKKTWQPSPNIGFGAGSTAAIQGLEVDDEQGKRTVKDPSVLWRAPVDSTPSVDAADRIYGTLLAEVGQAHVMLASEASPSGRSRREARADYEASLGQAILPIEAAGRWLIGAVLALAEHLMQSPGKYTGPLRPVFNLLPDAGPLEPADRSQNLVEWEKGARSLESVMLGAGITDPDAESARIGQEAGARLDLSRRQAEVAQLWIDLGASVELAGEIVGIDEEVIAKLAADRKLLMPQGGGSDNPDGGNLDADQEDGTGDGGAGGRFGAAADPGAG